MELQVTGLWNIPDSGILSIRAGGTRRQAQIAALDRPLKFPCKPQECTTLKVDVLDLRGSTRVSCGPDEREFSIHVEPVAEGGGPPMEVSFVLREAGSGPGAGDAGDDGPKAVSPKAGEDDRARDEKREVAAREYLEKHGLTSFMQFLMQSLMKDKPADPYAFLQKQVTRKMLQEVAKGVGEDGEVVLPAMTTEQLAELEREAEATCDQLRQDNSRLRDAVANLRSRYEELVAEGDKGLVAEHEGKDAAETAAPNAPGGSDAAPPAYQEIAAMQDEVSSLARENGALVEELARMREQIEGVREDMIAGLG